MECVTSKESEKRYTWVDSLKGIAICAIVWVHSGGGMIGSLLDPLGKAGAYWVQMFFILTVYLSYHSLKRIFEKNKSDNFFKDSIQWFLQRIWKLTPLYYFMLILYMVIVPAGANIWLGTTADKPSALNFIMHLLYLHSVFPYYANSIMWVEWYIGVMVIYLAIMPILCSRIQEYKDAVRTAVLLVSISISATGILSCLSPLKDYYIWNGWVYTYSLVCQLPAVACGILLYYLENILVKRRHSNLLCFIGVSAYIALSYLAEYGAEMRTVQIVKIAGFSLSFLLFILSGKAIDSFTLNNRMWQVIGRNSYAIYLLHFLLIYIFGYLINDDLAIGIMQSAFLWQIMKFILIIVVCLLFSTLYNRIIGERIYIWGKRKISEYFARF